MSHRFGAVGRLAIGWPEEGSRTLPASGGVASRSYDRVDVPDDQQQWIDINARLATSLPVIDRKQQPLSSALARKGELGF